MTELILNCIKNKLWTEDNWLTTSTNQHNLSFSLIHEHFGFLDLLNREINKNRLN